ncbi:hypothetical protein Lalb_Chr03g0039421 [Lupinus albus]|uniref:Uncharacterized protein n=1 Tax=Lupinus albus TaxID=3870 RepID=A0A6A4QTS9_LUPAL|nr:hypothetical protein Lalb_Chr03g0039421 [Lupinus albus]
MKSQNPFCLIFSISGVGDGDGDNDNGEDESGNRKGTHRLFSSFGNGFSFSISFFYPDHRIRNP